jgi:hypothetical protein
VKNLWLSVLYGGEPNEKVGCTGGFLSRVRGKNELRLSSVCHEAATGFPILLTFDTSLQALIGLMGSMGL